MVAQKKIVSVAEISARILGSAKINFKKLKSPIGRKGLAATIMSSLKLKFFP